MKSRNQIQILSKIGKILSKIAFICAIVEVAGCVIGLVTLAVGGDEIFKLGGVTIHNLIAKNGSVNERSIAVALATWLIISIGEIVLAWFAQCYFTHELEVGTPFSEEGAAELMRLGILTIAIPIGCSIIAGIVQETMAGLMNVTADFASDICFDNDGKVALGIMFIVLSVICKNAVEELQERTVSKNEEEE